MTGPHSTRLVGGGGADRTRRPHPCHGTYVVHNSRTTYGLSGRQDCPPEPRSVLSSSPPCPTAPGLAETGTNLPFFRPRPSPFRLGPDRVPTHLPSWSEPSPVTSPLPVPAFFTSRESTVLRPFSRPAPHFPTVGTPPLPRHPPLLGDPACPPFFFSALPRTLTLRLWQWTGGRTPTSRRPSREKSSTFAFPSSYVKKSLSVTRFQPPPSSSHEEPSLVNEDQVRWFPCPNGTIR